jgi:hypothetical protein
MVIKCFGWRSPIECLAWPAIECRGNGFQVRGSVLAEIGSLGEVLPEQAVGVLISAALPRTSRVAEIDCEPDVDAELGVLGHLRTLVPGQRLTQLCGRVVIVAAMASRTASAPWPAVASPFLTRGVAP